MPLILGFIGFILLTLVWLAWMAVALVAALVWLVWPLALLVFGGVMWRRQSRTWQLRPARSAETARPHTFSKESGNAALDDYREETLRRLDEESEKFRAFLERLRKSKDKQAFDSFIAERRGRPADGAQGLIA